MRIVTPNGKFVYFFLSAFVVAAVYAVMLSSWGERAAIVGSVPVSLLVVGYAVRNFRDPDVEPYEAPREWWRMTARPASGYVFGVIFLAQAFWVALSSIQGPYAWVRLLGAAADVLVAAMFFHSSRKLEIRAHGAAARP